MCTYCKPLDNSPDDQLYYTDLKGLDNSQDDQLYDTEESICSSENILKLMSNLSTLVYNTAGNQRYSALSSILEP